MKSALLVLSLTMAIAFAACAEEPIIYEEPTTAGLTAEKADDGTPQPLWTYFQVTRNDTRRCVYPLCGGDFVKRVNQRWIKCIDGSWARECYVGDYDFSALGMTEEEEIALRAKVRTGEAVVRGEMVAGYFPGFDDVAVFAVSEAWVAANDYAPIGRFYVANDNGVRCFTYPCPSYDATKLNKNRRYFASYADIDLSWVGATDAQLDAAYRALNGGGLMVAARQRNVSGPAGRAKGLWATQFYIQAKAAGPQICGTRGVGPCPEGQFCQWDDEADMCGAFDAPGTCADQPEFCTEQYDPVCGCDGQTYGNDCARQAAGVGFSTRGACEPDEGQICGGRNTEPCPEGQFCEWEDASDLCGAFDAPGACALQPEVCTADYAPVCGCDGRTFPNDCARRQHRVGSSTPGACEPEEGQICGTRGAGPCPEGQFCEWDEAEDLCGATDRPGTCAAQPALCTMEYMPVCGCDARTYSNECVRRSRGVGFSTPGPCETFEQSE